MKEFILSASSQKQFITIGKAWQQDYSTTHTNREGVLTGMRYSPSWQGSCGDKGLRLLVILYPKSGVERKLNAGPHLALSLLFSPDTADKMVPLTFRMGLLTLGYLIQSPHHRHPQRCVYQVILSLVKLTILMLICTIRFTL